jgi:hypothetical protein
MSKNSKPPLNELSPPYSIEFFEKIENLLNSLSDAEGSEVSESDIIHLGESLDGNPLLADFLFEKVLIQPSLRLTRFLFKLDGLIHSKPVHKGIKRTLYLLKQKGINISLAAEGKGEKGGRGILKEMVSVQVSGFLSEFDEVRNRMLALIIPQASKAKVFVFALINQERNLESLTALMVNKREAKGLLHDLEEKAGHPFLSADPGEVALILKEAHEQRSNLSKEDEGIYAQVINLLAGLKTIRQAPRIRSLIPVEDPSLENPPDWERLTQIREVAYFLPKAELLEPFEKAIRDVQEAILIISPSQKKQQIEEIVLRASRELFQGQTGEDLVRYLEELAYLYYLKSHFEEAELLFKAALFLARERGSGTSTENLLLLRLVERVLSSDKMMEDDSNQGPIIEKTPGGIIIPPWVKRGGGVS